MDAITGGMTAASLLYMLGDAAYHRWWYEPPKGKIQPQEVSIPRAEEGARIPLIYGRCRVRAPLLSWCGVPTRDIGSESNGWPDGVAFFRMDMFFRLGIGMDDGLGTNTCHGMWIGDNKAFPWSVARETEVLAELNAGAPEPGQIGGRAFWYDGHAGQTPSAQLSGFSGLSADVFGEHEKEISVVLYNSGGQWIIGSSPTVPAYSFEVSSYRDGGGYPGVGIYARIGYDSNPINVLWDLLKCTFGKLGISTSYLDSTSFDEAATTLYGESHGYSRCIEDVVSARDFIQEILRQIDGVLYADEEEQKIKIDLIRSDYDPATIPHITKDNCDRLENFVASGRSNLINRVVLEYTDRDNDYQDNTEPAQNPASSTANSQYSAESIRMPGVTHAALAATIAHRELAWRSRPMMKCRAICDRSKINLRPGMAVKLTWQKPDISGIIFRVADVDEGTLTDGRVAVDLIQDASYVFRGRIPEPPAPIDTGEIRGGVIVGFG